MFHNVSYPSIESKKPIKSLSKTERAQVFNKFGGKCAYCGCELNKNWHADHFEPVVRYNGECHYPERNRFENFMPACAPCNIAKSSMTIDEWRDMLSRNLAFMQTQSKFKLLEKHGLVKSNPKNVTFYFETYNEAKDVTGVSDV